MFNFSKDYYTHFVCFCLLFISILGMTQPVQNSPKHENEYHWVKQRQSPCSEDGGSRLFQPIPLNLLS